MAMGMKMSLKLSQQLRMTPQLQQAIKLLQLSRLELETEVRKELDENPVLEEVHESLEEEGLTKNQLADELKSVDSLVTQEASDPTKQDEFEWENYVDNLYKPSQNSGEFNDEIMNYENLISTTQTLHDYLTWQAKMFGFNEEEENIISLLIGYIDDDGYLSTPLEEIAQLESVELQDLVEMLPFLHEFDPPGVGARDLKECLLIQAKQLQEDTKDLTHVIENHMSDLERKNYPAIAKAMGLELSEIIEISQIILSMDPKPGRQFMTQETHFITPDVFVYKVGEEYVVSLNEDGLPKLRISNLYRNLLKTESSASALANKMDNISQASSVTNSGDGSSSKPAYQNTHDYVQDKLRSAIWLIKSIHQRQRTIFKVAESIVKHQKEFFDKGPGFIKPMILRDIASDIGMHESTVSRVTTNKYLHSPRGVFELKYFFNSGLSTTDGDSVASESVKLKIKELVENEDPKNPLSDQKLVEILKKDGIDIARRTVAKYRDVLRIQPSSKRKKYF